MASIREILTQIWSQFRRLGIADDLVIIEHIAALLTEGREPEDKRVRPRKPLEHSLDVGYVKEKLEEAARLAGGREILFDRYVLFRLSRMLPGSRYPTPRHIVTFMQRLIELEPYHRLADFACGSGGFLVLKNSTSQMHTATGCEISANWARLAWANCVLHGVGDVRIEIGNAVSLCSDSGPFADVSFDRILMNPPFGEAVDPALVEDAFGVLAGSRSETVFIQLALSKLAEEGRAGVLVPSGPLFSGARAEKSLRHKLLDNFHLEAVVSFPKDSFQPFSPLQTYLLCVKNEEPQREDYTWFFRAERDGYRAGRSRDLTSGPNLASDLPFVEAALLAQSSQWDKLFPENQPLLGIKKLIGEDHTPLGIIVATLNDAGLTSLDIFPTAPEQPLVLVGAKKDEEDQVWIRIHFSRSEAELVDNYEKCLLKTFGRKKRIDDLPRQRLPIQSDATRQIFLDREGRCLGVAILTLMIKTFDYDLRLEKYVPAIEEEKVIKSPATLLAGIRKNQKELMRRIDGLLGRLDMPAITKVQVPPPLWREEGEPLQPFGTLSEAQSKVWRSVSEKVQNWQENEAEYSTPVHFTADDVEPDGKVEASPTTKATLELLEKTGLIVPVSVVGSESQEAVSCYRLASERDRWELDQEQESEEQEGDTI